MTSNQKEVDEMERRREIVQDGMLDIRQAEDFTGLKKSKLYLLLRSGELPYCKIGGAMRIPKVALVEFLARALVLRDEDTAGD